MTICLPSYFGNEIIVWRTFVPYSAEEHKYELTDNKIVHAQVSDLHETTC